MQNLFIGPAFKFYSLRTYDAKTAQLKIKQVPQK